MWEDEHVLERVDREQRQVIHALAEVVQRVREPVSVRSQEVDAICSAHTNKNGAFCIVNQ